MKLEEILGGNLKGFFGQEVLYETRSGSIVR